MKPGVKLDVVIAKKLFGMKLNKNGASFVMDGHLVGHKFGKFRESLKANDWRPSLDGWWWNSALPKYSTSIADAWLVVEKMLESGHLFEMDFSDCIWNTRFNKGDWIEEITAPHGICEAALKAVDKS